MKKIFVVMALMMTTMLPVAAMAEETTEITDEQKNNIVANCDNIHNTLVVLQHNDSRTRVYLGRYYETISTDFITPLNVWLVGHNMSNAELVENQNDFAAERNNFVGEYITYQKALEDLVATDCKAEPAKFYDKLTNVRKLRAVVEKDVKKIRELMNEQVKLVTTLRETL